MELEQVVCVNMGDGGPGDFSMQELMLERFELSDPSGEQTISAMRLMIGREGKGIVLTAAAALALAAALARLASDLSAEAIQQHGFGQQ